MKDKKLLPGCAGLGRAKNTLGHSLSDERLKLHSDGLVLVGNELKIKNAKS
jgi:hypothetical protein